MLDIATRLALGPVLLAQAARLRRTAPSLPEPGGPRRGIEGRGRIVMRLLVVGDSSAAGVGASTQREALAQPLARTLARRFDGSVRWQLVAASGLTSEGVLQRLMRERPAAADVAVVIVGVNDITTDVPLAVALRHRSHIAHWLQVHAQVRHLIFPALPEMELFPAVPKPLAWYVGQAARRNNRAQARWAQRHLGVTHLPMQGVAHPELFCEDGFHPAASLYARVAERLSAARRRTRARRRVHHGGLMNLKGKTLFITGASRGIGLAIALRAARDGANVAIAAKTDRAASEAAGHDPYRGRGDRGGRRQGAADAVRHPRRECRSSQAARQAAPSASAASTSSSTTPARSR